MLEVRSALACDYASAHSPVHEGNLLAVVEFGENEGRPELREGIPHVPIRVGADANRFRELWSTGGTVISGRVGELVYSHDGQRMFCAGRIERSGGYRERTRAMYAAAFELADEQGYPNLFRMWNYIAGINDDNGEGLEIYRDFCRGRSEAFAAHDKRIPAATGVGSRGAGIVCYFLSSRSDPVIHIENPRQVPAYHYPREYGPRPPTFARATHLAHGGAGTESLFISGTASILGHATVAPGDVERQCEIALDNIRALVGAENLRAHDIGHGYRLSAIRRAKVYVRHREHLAMVRRKCGAVFAPDAEIVYLNVDICRRDLLVEIEGVA
ncbi:FkbO/Hyg5 family chorismatase [Nocardia sp. NPDC052566]|uniref:FkbO/Hyg5 family chorismatase n=1 Tax=Nocardia sp. NPDC052566 TaxID=3364330 RepID=UPI0037C783E7